MGVLWLPCQLHGTLLPVLTLLLEERRECVPVWCNPGVPSSPMQEGRRKGREKGRRKGKRKEKGKGERGKREREKGKGKRKKKGKGGKGKGRCGRGRGKGRGSGEAAPEPDAPQRHQAAGHHMIDAVGERGAGARQHRLEKQLPRYWTSQNPAAARQRGDPASPSCLLPPPRPLAPAHSARPQRALGDLGATGHPKGSPLVCAGSGTRESQETKAASEQSAGLGTHREKKLAEMEKLT